MSQSKSALAGQLSSQEQRAASVPADRYYTVITHKEPVVPFGFGSASPSRIEPKYPDTPGPGKYDQSQYKFHIESIRGRGLGFTSNVPRRLEWTKGNRNPSPSSYLPKIVDHHVKTKIGTYPQGRRCSCYPDERESALMPGPASYNLPELSDRTTTSVFRSKAKRDYIPPKPKHPPRFDGKTFTITRFDFEK
ncbi:hypothetical protein TRFO_39265 [Tritrichomonas foetus]|uniref:Uncharacterized protein n=1 Tax=Tritrichomonas foetus TaxID=1144522 RepID=A0A1J4JBD5_9EUKA|nr:hypothetical protein TRFO_39265 [Tritrichomonas foetus]|eukprot:OHS94556.1 hypothetical protein TRFO_39265 [Tritrichomonas foetus]